MTFRGFRAKHKIKLCEIVRGMNIANGGAAIAEAQDCYVHER